MARVGALVLLVLQVLGAARGRPSAAEAGVAESDLLSREELLAVCPSPPSSFATPQQLAGDWCVIVYPGPNSISQQGHCNRFSVRADGDRFLMDFSAIYEGQLVSAKNTTFNKLDNGSWLSNHGGERRNLFVGFPSDGQGLLACGSIAMPGERMRHKEGYLLSPCPAPGAEGPLAERCNAPAPTPAPAAAATA